MMPGEGSVHQILVVLHLQDMGQAREALQKPKTSKHKPQSRAMAGPCHLGQGDIPSCQCQSVGVRVPTLSQASPARGGRPSLRPLAAWCWWPPAEWSVPEVEPVGAGAEQVGADQMVHSGWDITGSCSEPQEGCMVLTPGTTRWISLDSLGRRTAKSARISISARTSGLRTNRHG